MNRVLLVTVPVQDTSMPPGVLSILAACCEQTGSDYQPLDLNLYLYKNFDETVVTEINNDFYNNRFRNSRNQTCYDQVCEYFVKYVDEYQPTHIAISVFTYASILATYHLLKFLQKDRNFKIVLGGAGLQQTPLNVETNLNFGQYCLEQHLADYVVFGEGDIAFTEILKGNIDYPGINQDNGTQILNLDNLPVPSYKKVNPNEYFYADRPKALITGSRGCVRTCTFCDVMHLWPKYVFKSGKRIAHEMLEIWQTTGVNKFDFSDSLINGSMKSFRELNQTIIQLKSQYPGFAPLYSGQFICRPQNEHREQDYLEMTQAGCETLVVGIESFSESVRDHMKKKFNNDAIDWHFAMSAKYNIKNTVLLISGYVTETIEDHTTTLEYLKKYQVYALSRTIAAISVDPTGLNFLEHSPLYARADELNVHFDDPKETLTWTSLDNPTLTLKERLRRSVEVLLVAHDLGYKIIHLRSKIDEVTEKVKTLRSKKLFKIFPL